MWNFFITTAECIFFSFFASFFVWSFYWLVIRKIKPKKGKRRQMKHGSKFKRLFIDLPRQLSYDLLNSDPEYFREYGVHIVAGEQGSGKTMTVAYLLRKYQTIYPRVYIKTNFYYAYQDGEIHHWKDIVKSENGIYGEIDVIDEIQNWFNSLQSKDFPIEMMNEITQQRKQRKIILGTSQVFTRVSKPIREQTYVLYEPHTFFGCLTLVFIFKPEIKADSGTPDKKKFRGVFFFVHDKELRESYDTYHKIEEMSKEGFKPFDEHVRADSANVFVERKKNIFGK